MPTRPDDSLAAVAWRDHGGELLAFARRRLGDAADAEDVVQEALLNLSASGVEAEDVRALAYTVLRRRIADCLRKRAVRERHAAEAEAELAGATPGFRDDGLRAASVTPWTADPSVVAQGAEFWADFAASVDRLPPKCRQAFCLREIDGEPTDAVCELLGVSPPALWGLIHRARLRLRDDLAHHFAVPKKDERR